MNGAIVDMAGRRLDPAEAVQPHMTRITSDAQVQIYQAVIGDNMSRVTHVLLQADRYLKDNRIPPRGYSATHPNASMTAIVGTTGDTDFGMNGSDQTTYAVRVPASGALRVEVELLYKSVQPSTYDVLSVVNTPAARRFVSMGRMRPPVPRRVAMTMQAVP